jgi:hypothetical protein
MSPILAADAPELADIIAADQAQEAAFVRAAAAASTGSCGLWTPENGCPEHTGRPAMGLPARALGAAAEGIPAAVVIPHKSRARLHAENENLRRQVAKLDRVNGRSDDQLGRPEAAMHGPDERAGQRPR